MAQTQLLDKHAVSRAIYGSVSILAVLLVMQSHPPSAWTAAVMLFGTSLAIALAETYSETIAEMIGHQRQFAARELAAIWRRTRPILVAANLPTAIVLLSVAGLYSVSTALNVAEFAVYAALFVWGLRVGQLMHDSWPRIIASGLATVAIGVLIGLIKVIFH